MRIVRRKERDKSRAKTNIAKMPFDTDTTTGTTTIGTTTIESKEKGVKQPSRKKLQKQQKKL